MQICDLMNRFQRTSHVWFIAGPNVVPRFCLRELTSRRFLPYLGQKSKCVWERLRASFLNRKSNGNDSIQLSGFFEKVILGTSGSVIYGEKMTLAQLPEIVFLSRIHGIKYERCIEMPKKHVKENLNEPEIAKNYI